MRVRRTSCDELLKGEVCGKPSVSQSAHVSSEGGWDVRARALTCVALGRWVAFSRSSPALTPPALHRLAESQSGSATPGLTQVPSTRSRGLLNCRK